MEPVGSSPAVRLRLLRQEYRTRSLEVRARWEELRLLRENGQRGVTPEYQAFAVASYQLLLAHRELRAAIQEIYDQQAATRAHRADRRGRAA